MKNIEIMIFVNEGKRNGLVIRRYITQQQYERISLILIEDAKITRRKPRDAKGRFIKK